MQVGKFLQKYGGKGLFPIKLQVPIMFTVYLLLCNKCLPLLFASPFRKPRKTVYQLLLFVPCNMCGCSTMR